MSLPSKRSSAPCSLAGFTQAERLLGALFLLWAALVAQLKCELITRIVMKSNLLWCFMVTSWRQNETDNSVAEASAA